MIHLVYVEQGRPLSKLSDIFARKYLSPIFKNLRMHLAVPYNICLHKTLPPHAHYSPPTIYIGFFGILSQSNLQTSNFPINQYIKQPLQSPLNWTETVLFSFVFCDGFEDNRKYHTHSIKKYFCTQQDKSS